MLKILHLLLVLIFTKNASSVGSFHLIQDFFEVKFIKQAIIFGCFNKQDQIFWTKLLMQQYRPISFFGTSQHKLKKIRTHNHLGMVLFADCPNTDEFLLTCEKLNFFGVKHHWLIISLNSGFEKFENVSLNINADVNVVFWNSTFEIWDVYDIYNPAFGRGGTLKIKKIGFYDIASKFFFQNNHEGKYWRRKNVTGVTFNSVVVLPEPFEGSLNDYLNNDTDRNVNTFNRFHNRLMCFCREYYNYSVNIKVDKSWGYTTGDGNFDGLVGALQRKTADFGSSPLFFRLDRSKVIDYGRNTWILRAAFIFRNPKAKTSLEFFLRPLPTSGWCITGLLAIFAVCIFRIVTNFESGKNRDNSWGVAVLFTIGAFCQQGSPTTPKMVCGRIATLSVFLLSVLIYQFYSASLVSHLLMKPFTKIKTLKDVLDSSLKAGCQDILYDKDYFRYTTDKVARELYTQKILYGKNSSNFLEPIQGLKKVGEGNFAFHVETATAYPIIEATFNGKQICELKEVQLFRTQPMYANFQKNSPFKDMIDVCLQRLAENGILYRERMHWHPRKPECLHYSKFANPTVTLEEFYPALVVLITGIVASLTVLLIEIQISFIIMKKRSTEPSLTLLVKRRSNPKNKESIERNYGKFTE